MLIDHYDLEVFTPPCEPGAERYAAKARLRVDISTVLPYLNATLRGAVYHRAANALTWKNGGHTIAFHAHEIAISNLEDADAAVKELDRLIALVNHTWERRAELTPDDQTHQRPTPMAVYKLLPQTNCKQCGEPTCFTFALKLAAGQKQIGDCPPLLEPGRQPALAALQAIITAAPAIGYWEADKRVPMQIHFFATLRHIVGGKTIELPTDGSLTVRQLLAEVVARYPPLRAELFDEQGELYRHVHVLINGRDVVYLEAGLDAPVAAHDTVNIFPAVAGGAA